MFKEKTKTKTKSFEDTSRPMSMSKSKEDMHYDSQMKKRRRGKKCLKVPKGS